MATRCPYCKMVNYLDARQCGGCGHDLVGSSQPEPGRWSWLGNLFGGASSRSVAKPTAPTEQLSSRCPYCRVANFPNAQNCTGCGHPLNVPLQIQKYKPPFSERVRDYFSGHWQGFAGSLAVLVAVLIFAGFAASEKQEEESRRARCTRYARGTLNPNYTKVTKTVRVRWVPISKTTYEVTYRFQVAGKTYDGHDSWNFEPTERAIVVTYDPDDPSNNLSDQFKKPEFYF